MQKYLVTKQFKRRIFRHFKVFAVILTCLLIGFHAVLFYCVVSAHSETLQ